MADTIHTAKEKFEAAEVAYTEAEKRYAALLKSSEPKTQEESQERDRQLTKFRTEAEQAAHARDAAKKDLGKVMAEDRKNASGPVEIQEPVAETSTEPPKKRRGSKPVTRAVVGQMITKGVIDPEEGHRRFRAMGYSEADADELVQLSMSRQRGGGVKQPKSKKPKKEKSGIEKLENLGFALGKFVPALGQLAGFSRDIRKIMEALDALFGKGEGKPTAGNKPPPPAATHPGQPPSSPPGAGPSSPPPNIVPPPNQKPPSPPGAGTPSPTMPNVPSAGGATMATEADDAPPSVATPVLPVTPPSKDEAAPTEPPIRGQGTFGLSSAAPLPPKREAAPPGGGTFGIASGAQSQVPLGSSLTASAAPPASTPPVQPTQSPATPEASESPLPEQKEARQSIVPPASQKSPGMLSKAFGAVNSAVAGTYGRLTKDFVKVGAAAVTAGFMLPGGAIVPPLAYGAKGVFNKMQGKPFFGDKQQQQPSGSISNTYVDLPPVAQPAGETPQEQQQPAAPSFVQQPPSEKPSRHDPITRQLMERMGLPEQAVKGVSIEDNLRASGKANLAEGSPQKGVFNTKTREIRIHAQEAKNKERFEKVMSHELGHVLDLVHGGGKGLASRQQGSEISNIVEQHGHLVTPPPEEMAKLSPGRQKYLNRPEEKFARLNAMNMTQKRIPAIERLYRTPPTAYPAKPPSSKERLSIPRQRRDATEFSSMYPPASERDERSDDGIAPLRGGGPLPPRVPQLPSGDAPSQVLSRDWQKPTGVGDKSTQKIESLLEKQITILLRLEERLGERDDDGGDHSESIKEDHMHGDKVKHHKANGGQSAPQSFVPRKGSLVSSVLNIARLLGHFAGGAPH
jgi:hypothetical protein